jgi:hypothetical protein
MPPGPKRMVVGFNHNIKYRGKTYHAQTEDSGADRPQVATHLFLGGNIIASKRTSYADIAGAENLHDVVRALMQEQHKEVLRNLVSGVYDHATPPGSPSISETSTPARAFAPTPVAAPRPAPPPAPPPPPREVPVDPKDTIFGEDLISERSLDEVILAYLAGDTGGRKP